MATPGSGLTADLVRLLRRTCAGGGRQIADPTSWQAADGEATWRKPRSVRPAPTVSPPAISAKGRTRRTAATAPAHPRLSAAAAALLGISASGRLFVAGTGRQARLPRLVRAGISPERNGAHAAPAMLVGAVLNAAQGFFL